MRRGRDAPWPERVETPHGPVETPHDPVVTPYGPVETPHGLVETPWQGVSTMANVSVRMFEVRSSPIQGQGVFARCQILKGARIIEYTGERITHREADARYDEEAMEHPHTVLFTVDRNTVIDAGVGGNEARFINHSCEPNCEAVNEDGHIFIDALYDILPGEELCYDYHLEYQGRYRAEWKERYACHCGTPSCHGTLLLPKRQRRTK